MSEDVSLSPLIAATTEWLLRAYPSGPGAFQRSLAEAQARQAVTVAAWLRYPTELDAELVLLTGPGGTGRLDWVTGADGSADAGEDPGEDPGADAWRTWVDEVVASWAVSLLSDPGLAAAAMGALAGTAHAPVPPVVFRRLTEPDAHDRGAAGLLRHPDLVGPVAELHRGGLEDRLRAGTSLTG
ncbi:hypothetical protein [Streptomyces sp. NPDC012888]|uniref:hypothetical protein n=1 Tax=Streptomyces sp. NPDC012888 TaxID=3364855 RepID=UPI003699B5FE